MRSERKSAEERLLTRAIQWREIAHHHESLVDYERRTFRRLLREVKKECAERAAHVVMYHEGSAAGFMLDRKALSEKVRAEVLKRRPR